MSILQIIGQILTDFLGGGHNMKKKLCAKTQKVTIFQIQGGGGLLPPEFENFDQLPRRGHNMKKKNCCVQKHQKSLFFKFRGGHLPPP